MYNGEKKLAEAVGYMIRESRREAKLTGLMLAANTGIHYSRLSRIERGLEPVRLDEMRSILNVLKVSDEQADTLMSMTSELTNSKSNWSPLIRANALPLTTIQREIISTDQKATGITWFEPCAIPGLLQTPEYAKAIFFEHQYPLLFGEVSLSDRELAFKARMERQAVLYETTKKFQFIILESALRTNVISSESMIHQLNKIRVISHQPNVDIKIVPDDIQLPLLVSSPFVIYDQDLLHVDSSIGNIGTAVQPAIDEHLKIFTSFEKQSLQDYNAQKFLASRVEALKEAL